MGKFGDYPDILDAPTHDYKKWRLDQVFDQPKENEETQMPLPTPVDNNTPSQTNSRRQKMVFLKAAALNETKQTAKILAVKYDAVNRYGPQVVLKLSFNGDTVFLGVNITTANYRALLAAFTDNEKSWEGKSINLFLTTNSFSEQSFITVEPTNEVTTKRR